MRTNELSREAPPVTVTCRLNCPDYLFDRYKVLTSIIICQLSSGASTQALKPFPAALRVGSAIPASARTSSR
jgi:hypothetical protein